MICTSEVIRLLVALECAIAVLWIVYTKLIVCIIILYGSELWDLNCNYEKDFKVVWRKVKLRIWKLPYRAHNAIVHTLSYDIDLKLDTRKFVHLGLNHSNMFVWQSYYLSFAVYRLHSHLITGICLLSIIFLTTTGLQM